MKKIALSAFVLVLLSTVVVVEFKRPSVGHANGSNSSFGDGKFVFASSKTIWVPDNFTSIQEAVNNASDGDAIFVRANTYYENVIIDKSISLIGESKKSTIIDGGGANRTVIEVTANNVAISGFAIQNSSRAAGTSYAGIKISGRACNITGNHVRKNKIGIFVTSQKSRITKNIVTSNGQGIALYHSSEATVEANNVTANTVGISLALSSNNMIVDNRAANSYTGGHGITLSLDSFNNTIFGNDLTNNYHGIWLSSSFNNSILENIIADNELLGIELASSPGNTFYHNNFINNPKHVVIDNKSISIWDDGYPSGGNYWSAHNPPDLHSGPYHNETGSDGISDTSYDIDENNRDNYPLMGMFSSFNTSLGYNVNVISNSTIEDFQYFESNSTIKITVSNVTANQTHGWCRLTIPHDLLSPTYNVIINDTVVPYTTVFENETLSIIYFSYEHSILEIIVIPEFPTWALILVLLTVLTVATAIYKRKLLKHQTTNNYST